jgi:hypothetical protein
MNNKNKFCPFIVACTSFLDENIERQAKECGFHLAIESPLTYKILEEEIFVRVIDMLSENYMDNLAEADFSGQSQIYSDM